MNILSTLSFQLLQAQEKINSLQSNTQSVKKEKKQKQKQKVIDDLCDDEPSPVTQSISKPPPMPVVEEIPVVVAAAAAAVEPLPKPAKPAKAKPLSHKKTAQKPVTNTAVVVADIPDPVPPAPQAAALEPDFRQDLKRLATLLPQLPGLIV